MCNCGKLCDKGSGRILNLLSMVSPLGCVRGQDILYASGESVPWWVGQENERCREQVTWVARNLLVVECFSHCKAIAGLSGMIYVALDGWRPRMCAHAMNECIEFCFKRLMMAYASASGRSHAAGHSDNECALDMSGAGPRYRGPSAGLRNQDYFDRWAGLLRPFPAKPSLEPTM